MFCPCLLSPIESSREDKNMLTKNTIVIVLHAQILFVKANQLAMMRVRRKVTHSSPGYSSFRGRLILQLDVTQ